MGPRGGAWFKTTAAGRRASKQMSAVVRSARRSRMPGRSGISARSAARAASRAELSECGAVSMIARSAPCARAVPSASSKRVAGTGATTGRASVRWSPHPAALAWGSRSMRTARWPTASAATARLMASVVLPVLPFSATSVIVYTYTNIHYYVRGSYCASVQAEVLPLPTAPKMAIPVYTPRSGMVSHPGLKISLASTG